MANFLCFGPGGALARGGEHVSPGVQHLHQVIAALFIRETQDIGLLGEVQPGERIKLVSIGVGDAPEGGFRILSHGERTDPEGHDYLQVRPR